MAIWDICIRRPIFTLMLVSAPVVLGLASLGMLGVDLFPNVDLPVVTVTTTLRGASVEEMETSVTKPIEEIVNTVAGIDELRSTTKEGISFVTVQFRLSKNGDVGAQEVDAKVRSILSQLPEGTDPPIIDKFALDAAPIMTIAISGRRDLREVTEIARKRIKEDLETLPNIGAVTLVGGRLRALNVIIEPDRLQKYQNLTVEDVRLALVRENQEQPGGRVDRGQSELVLRTLGRIEKPADFARLIIASRNGQPIRIEDIGRVEDSYEEPRSLSRLWSKDEAGEDEPGDHAVSLIVQKQSGSNTVAVVDHVRKRLDALLPTLPDDIRTEVIRDQSRFIRKSIDEVQLHLLLAAVLVGGSILLFLRDWRTTLIATLAIPMSIVGTFALMYGLGLTLNNITMLGLILAVGIVVDDAVVVHENIYRHIEEYGLPAREAASKATREIALAVLATTLSLLVIFLPIVFMGGRVGRFFSSFGYVVAFSVLLSLFVSFTMTPMLCSRFLKPLGHSKEGWFNRIIENSYIALLGWSLRHRWVIVITSLLILFSTPFLAAIAGMDFVPKDDQSEFEVSITLPEGCTLEQADQTLMEIDRRVRKLRGVTHSFMVIGDTTGRVTKGQGDVTKATLYFRLTDLAQRKFTQFDVMKEARTIMEDYPDLRSAVQEANAIQGSGFRQVDIDLNLRGPDIARLEEYSRAVMKWMREEGSYVDVDSSLSLRKPELRIRPDRERLSDLGVSIQNVSTTTNVLVGGIPVSKYKEAEEQYDVWLRADWEGRNDRESIGRIAVPATNAPGHVTELRNVVRFEGALGPNTIERFSRQRQVVVSANLLGKDLGSGVRDVSAYIDSLNLPPEYRFEFLGRAKIQSESNSNFLIAFGLAFLFMYMILAAQFESLLHPVSILAALPLTIPFALLSLIALRTSLDIYAMFGLFMLFGIVKKNGILQVDCTNQLRAQGLTRDAAILQANRTRLRPILMTTVMLVAAMMPMALGQGPGAQARASMAKVILGGQALSLLLTLLLTPVAYSLFDSAGSRLQRWWHILFGPRSHPSNGSTIEGPALVLPIEEPASLG